MPVCLWSLPRPDHGNLVFLPADIHLVRREQFLSNPGKVGIRDILVPPLSINIGPETHGASKVLIDQDVLCKSTASCWFNVGIAGIERPATVYFQIDLTVFDTAVPLLTPGCTPTVLDDPALPAVIVTHNTDAVITSKGAAGCLLVDAASVRKEIAVDSHASHDRSYCGNGILTGLYAAVAGVA